MDPSKTKAVGAIGVPATRTTHGTGRENISVLMSCSANGIKGPPLFIFKGKSVWDAWIPKDDEGFPGCTYAATDNGWIEWKVFFNFIEKSFIQHTRPSIDDPLLLIYDGHTSHVSLDLIEMAKKNYITIILLPPHSSHLLQPLDLSVFKSLKNTWDQRLVSYTRQSKGKKNSEK